MLSCKVRSVTELQIWCKHEAKNFVQNLEFVLQNPNFEIIESEKLEYD